MANKMFTEPCPFHELTLFNARAFSKVFSDWTSTAYQHKISDLALALVYFDGVINHEELLLAVEVLLFGKVFSDGDSLFVDVASARLGRRRLILSTHTLFILHQLKSTVDDANRMRLAELLSSELDALMHPYRQQVGAPVSSLELLCVLAQDFYAMRVHGPLREWLAGTLRARTLRVEALARHTFNQPEPLEFGRRQSRRPRSVLSDGYVRDVLDEATDNREYGGSASLRVKRIRDQLSLAMGGFLLVADQVGAEYVIFLCAQRNIKSPGTISNHYLNVRDFIRYSARDASNYDEFVNQDWAQQT